MENNLDFGGQHVRAFQGVANIVVATVYSNDLNPEVNLLGTILGEMPLSFKDGQSWWPLEATQINYCKKLHMMFVSLLIKTECAIICILHDLFEVGYYMKVVMNEM